MLCDATMNEIEEKKKRIHIADEKILYIYMDKTNTTTLPQHVSSDDTNNKS